jgi:hypothetical protein
MYKTRCNVGFLLQFYNDFLQVSFDNIYNNEVYEVINRVFCFCIWKTMRMDIISSQIHVCGLEGGVRNAYCLSITVDIQRVNKKYCVKCILQILI